jgi:hypothetical protein
MPTIRAPTSGSTRSISISSRTSTVPTMRTPRTASTPLRPREDRAGSGRSERSRASKARTVQQRTFPKWAWPNVGDRVWTNGSLDLRLRPREEVCLRRDPDFHICLDERAYFHSEIHPPRAIASMRNQAATLPSSGTTPVPVTATDLYIHGRAGMVGDVLQCGMPVVLGGGPATYRPIPTGGSRSTEDFEFDICLPGKANRRRPSRLGGRRGAPRTRSRCPSSPTSGESTGRSRNAPTRARRWMERRASMFASRSAARA